jgi:hypothetical protein
MLHLVDFGDARSLSQLRAHLLLRLCSGTVYVVAHADDDLLVSFVDLRKNRTAADLASRRLVPIARPPHRHADQPLRHHRLPQCR